MEIESYKKKEIKKEIKKNVDGQTDQVSYRADNQ